MQQVSLLATTKWSTVVYHGSWFGKAKGERVRVVTAGVVG